MPSPVSVQDRSASAYPQVLGAHRGILSLSVHGSPHSPPPGITLAVFTKTGKAWCGWPPDSRVGPLLIVKKCGILKECRTDALDSSVIPY